jgi:hypothetical protein
LNIFLKSFLGNALKIIVFKHFENFLSGSGNQQSSQQIRKYYAVLHIHLNRTSFMEMFAGNEWKSFQSCCTYTLLSDHFNHFSSWTKTFNGFMAHSLYFFQIFAVTLNIQHNQSCFFNLKAKMIARLASVIMAVFGDKNQFVAIRGPMPTSLRLPASSLACLQAGLVHQGVDQH